MDILAVFETTVSLLSAVERANTYHEVKWSTVD